MTRTAASTRRGFAATSTLLAALAVVGTASSASAAPQPGRPQLLVDRQQCGTVANPTYASPSRLPELTLSVPKVRGELDRWEVEFSGGKLAEPVVSTAGWGQWGLNPVPFPSDAEGHVLAGDGVYALRARVLDGVGYGPWSSRCFVVLDSLAPGLPSLDLPAPGTEGIFDLSQVLTLTLGPGASRDVASYQWAVNDEQWKSWVPGTDAPTFAPPTTPGENVLRVRAVDRAGNAGPVLERRFTTLLRAKKAVHRWALDERSGGAAADSGTAPSPLRLYGGASFLPEGSGGNWYSPQYGPADGALHVDARAASGGAATKGAPIDTTRDFSVTLWVRPTADLVSSTFLRQEGAFSLGTTTVKERPWDASADVRRAFQVTLLDTAGKTTVLTVPGIVAGQDRWFALALSYTAATRHVQVMAFDNDNFMDDYVRADLAAPLARGGVLRLGGAWTGDLDDVTTYDMASSAQYELSFRTS